MSRPGPRITTVVFDFDGVLADTERLHLTAFQRVFADRGWSLDETTYFDRYLGYDDRGLVLAFNEDQGLGLGPVEVDTLVAGKGQVFADFLASGDVLFPGARACVERLAANFSLAIASGALRAEILAILGAADLLRYFPVIVSADDVTSCKPSPEPYLTAAQQLGVIPSACAAVEDSMPGLAAARAAGMRTIGITTTVPGHALTLADRVIDRLDDLSLDLVSRLGAGTPV
jgi:beta-phosphoglucomutase